MNNEQALRNAEADMAAMLSVIGDLLHSLYLVTDATNQISVIDIVAIARTKALKQLRQIEEGRDGK